jgi:hypothetical protein
MPVRLRAVNTALESDNKIHDDSVAGTFGFRGGLVPGVTVYGYLASAAIEHFGHEWLVHGAMDVRFYQPVYDGDEVTVSAQPEAAGRLNLAIADHANGLAWIDSTPEPRATDYPEAPIERRPASRESLAPGTVLGTLIRKLDLAQARMSAPIDPSIGPERFAHPAILLALANEILVTNYVLGPWIHVSSEVRKSNSLKDGDDIQVRARIENRFERKGHEFVVLNVLILGPSLHVIESIRHTAIWRPRAPQ